MNREQHLQNHFPLEDGTTYIGNLDNVMCEYSGLPNPQSYATNSQTQTEGGGVGGESFKENFIDSSEPITSGSWDDNKIHTEQDFMYNWIRKHSGK
jgi:hypothetical protein